ncbi:cupin domain-containing protein [Methylophilus sp. 14]|uniref:cupin domain-containing protein n=1 Tax=Methylophilus sp. 14 TaxID=2781019 RepID=UPI00188DF75C|nr:cupin domain-containing protein [Methylophilus sp. 14]MBF4988147.1 cupin domain-containing protein [Methylophilus sp. 14]
MLVNSNFLQQVVITPDQYDWVNSNQPGVIRMMLDRMGGEQARATSLVKYAKGAHFPHHYHPGGEEILVLEGTFSEGSNHYSAGWYLRNPPGSKHQPFSPDGATIFVKLRQMHPSESLPLRLNTNDQSLWTLEGREGKCPLFVSSTETVWLERLRIGAILNTTKMMGLELLVMKGEVDMDGLAYPAGSWIRVPVGHITAITATQANTTIYIKTGHLQGVI